MEEIKRGRKNHTWNNNSNNYNAPDFRRSNLLEAMGGVKLKGTLTMRKKSFIGYVIRSWKSSIKLTGVRPNDRYYIFPEIGEKPIRWSKTKVKITIQEIKLKGGRR